MKSFAGGVLWVVFFGAVIQGQEPTIKTIYIDKTLIKKTRGECVEFIAHHYYSLWSNSTFVWYKYAKEVEQDKRTTLVTDDKKTLKIINLQPDDGALYTAKVVTKSLEGTQIEEMTRHWLSVADCKPYEKKLDFDDCKPACDAACAEDWLHSGGKCFKYFTEAKTWVDAYYHCKALGAKLATIDSSEENSFLGNLLDTAEGGWIGLNDQSEENGFIWNYDETSRPTYTAWGHNEPNNFNRICNAENCVQMKVSNKKWNDVVCDAKFNFVCERTEPLEGWTCNDVNKCYKYVKNSLKWVEANNNCTAIGGTLSKIQSSSENKFVGGLIGSNIWIGLNDRAEAGVYVWNDYGTGQFSNRMTYSNWDVKEPNDKHYFMQSSCTGEDCVLINKERDTTLWFDGNCKKKIPFICEKDKGPFLSFAAWIAISMGGCLVLSIFAGRAYMSFRHQKGRNQVKEMIVDAISGEKKRKDSL